MAEFYEVLKRAVGALPGNTGDARRAIYERARKALIAQLEGFSPPLTPSEITSQRLSLEEAIRKVEGEAARAALGLGKAAPPRPTQPPKPAAGPGSGQSPGQSRVSPQAPPPSPQTLSPSPAPSVGSAGAAAKPSASAPSSDASASTSKPSVASTNGESVAQTDGANELRSATASGSAQGAANGPAPGASVAPAQTDAGNGGAQIPPLASGAEPQMDSLAGAVEQSDYPESGESELQSPLEAGGYEDFPQEFKSSRLPMIVGGLAAFLIVVGLSAVLYSQRDALFGDSTSPAGKTVDTEPAAEVAKVEPEVKAPSRVESPPPEKSTDRIPQSTGVVRTVPTQRVVVPSGAENGALNATRSEALDKMFTPGSDDKPTGEPGAATALTSEGATSGTEVARVEPAASAAAPGAVAQTAILYEEGSAGGAAGTGDGKAVNGQVVWGKQKDGAVSSVLADVAIPDKASNVKITIRPNTEDGFPASHLVEMQFSGPLGTSIRTVPGLIMKATEQAQGDALVGAAIKVTDGLFWIALSAEDKDLVRNKKLLEDRGWIDIPLLYSSGKRAILTIEKGVPGGKAIGTAFKDWAKN